MYEIPNSTFFNVNHIREATVFQQKIGNFYFFSTPNFQPSKTKTVSNSSSPSSFHYTSFLKVL